MLSVIYSVDLSNEADKQLFKLEKKNRLLAEKITLLIEDTRINPRSGRGKPERLKGYGSKVVYSRRIDQKNRLVYEIKDKEILVYIFSVVGHYGDH